MTLRKRVSKLWTRPSEQRTQHGSQRPAKAREKASARRQSKPGGETSAKGRAAQRGKGSAAAAAVVVEAGKLGREMLAIPAQLYMALAELAGRGVLGAWQRVAWPLALAIWAVLGALYRLALREVTPARAVFAVAVAGALALGASQWLDYRAISIGTDAYSGDVGLVAPAPEIEVARAGDAHGWVMVPLAAAALVVLGVAAFGRPRLARLLIAIGLVAIGVALAVDAPKGLDEGAAAIAYEGAAAHLLEGFWLQLASAAALIACGLLLPGYLRSKPAPEPEPGGPGRLTKLAAAAAERAVTGTERAFGAAREAARKRARRTRERPARPRGKDTQERGGAGAPPRGAPS